MITLTQAAEVAGLATTPIVTFALTDNTDYLCTIQASVIDSVTGDSADYEYKFGIKRFGGGVATQVGATATVLEVEDVALAAGAITIVPTLNDVVINYVNPSANPVEVKAEFSFMFSSIPAP